MDTQQTDVQREIARHLCQAHAVQIRNLQNSLQDTINQTNKALEENKPELAQNLWKQVVRTTQDISHLFNQTTSLMYQPETPNRQSRRRGYNSFPTRKLNHIARQVDELVAARE